MDTKFNQVKSAMHQLLTEPQVMDWEDPEDVQIQQAMHKVVRWETRRLEVDKNFQDYGSLVSIWARDQISQPGSNYSNLKTDVTDFNSQLKGVPEPGQTKADKLTVLTTLPTPGNYLESDLDTPLMLTVIFASHFSCLILQISGR